MSWSVTTNKHSLGPLDISVDAGAAYGLRNLYASYGGAVVRVRRQGDNAEKSFTATQVLDGTLLAFCGSGDGYVSTWFDQSRNGNNLQFRDDGTYPQTRPQYWESQPKIVNQGSLVVTNGKPALDFNGAGTGFCLRSYPPAAAQSVFIVNRPIVRLAKPVSTDGKVSAIIGFRLNPYVTESLALVYNNEEDEYGFTTNQGDVWGIANASSVYENYAIHYALFKSGNPETSGLQWYINDVEQSLSRRAELPDPSAEIGYGMSIGMASSYSENTALDQFDGHIQEVVIYPSDKAKIRSAIIANMNQYYGVFT